VTAPRAIREFPFAGDPWPAIGSWANDRRFRAHEETAGKRLYRRHRGWAPTWVLVLAAHDVVHVEAWVAPKRDLSYGLVLPEAISVEPGGFVAFLPRRSGRRDVNRLLADLGAPPITEAIDPDGRTWETLQIRIADAGNLSDAGRKDDSRELWHQILPIAERLFGQLHGITLTGRLDLAVVELEAGDAEQALADLQRIVPDLELVVGPDAPWTLNAKESLAVALAAAGRGAEANDLAARTVEDFVRVLGPTHPRAQKAKRNYHRRDWSTGRISANLDLRSGTHEDP
jgi:Tetratricopeptide repeat